MSDAEAAVVAAAAAAAASLVVAFVSVVSSRRNEARSAHRAILGPFLEDLGRNIAGVVATSRVFLARAEQKQTLASWQDRMDRHAKELMDLRARVRYPLYGVEDALRVLSRVASWAKHLKDGGEHREDLIELADGLRSRLDKVVAKSYRRGEPPSRWDRRKVDRQARRVEEVWAVWIARDVEAGSSRGARP